MQKQLRELHAIEKDILDRRNVEEKIYKEQMQENLKREKRLREQMQGQVQAQVQVQARKPTPYVKAPSAKKVPSFRKVGSPKKVPIVIAPVIAPKRIQTPYVKASSASLYLTPSYKTPENITLTIKEPAQVSFEEKLPPAYETEPFTLEKTTDLSYEDDDLSYRE
jgi:hypothetical protein